MPHVRYLQLYPYVYYMLDPIEVRCFLAGLQHDFMIAKSSRIKLANMKAYVKAVMFFMNVYCG